MLSTNKRKRQQPLSRASQRIAKKIVNDGKGETVDVVIENDGKGETIHKDGDTNKHPRLDSTTNKKVSLMLLYNRNILYINGLHIKQSSF